jgi:hypothetical protein
MFVFAMTASRPNGDLAAHLGDHSWIEALAWSGHSRFAQIPDYRFATVCPLARRYSFRRRWAALNVRT